MSYLGSNPSLITTGSDFKKSSQRAPHYIRPTVKSEEKPVTKTSVFRPKPEVPPTSPVSQSNLAHDIATAFEPIFTRLVSNQSNNDITSYSVTSSDTDNSSDNDISGKKQCAAPGRLFFSDGPVLGTNRFIPLRGKRFIGLGVTSLEITPDSFFNVAYPTSEDIHLSQLVVSIKHLTVSGHQGKIKVILWASHCNNGKNSEPSVVHILNINVPKSRPNGALTVIETVDIFLPVGTLIAFSVEGKQNEVCFIGSVTCA